MTIGSLRLLVIEEPSGEPAQEEHAAMAQSWNDESICLSLVSGMKEFDSPIAGDLRESTAKYDQRNRHRSRSVVAMFCCFRPGLAEETTTIQSRVM